MLKGFGRSKCGYVQNDKIDFFFFNFNIDFPQDWYDVICARLMLV